jgi:hypothetical protein
LLRDGHYAELHKNQFKDDGDDRKERKQVTELVDQNINDLSSVSFIEQSWYQKKVMAMATMALISPY